MLCLGAPGLGSGDPMLWELIGERVNTKLGPQGHRDIYNLHFVHKCKY